MDFALPEDLRMLKETVHLGGPDLKPDVRASLEKKAKELGLWPLDVPEEYGGMGLGHLGMVVVWEELARTVALPPRGSGVFGPDVRPVPFMLKPEQKEKYLLPVLQRTKKPPSHRPSPTPAPIRG
jgi:acyl-CoA dehydrogenase